MQQSQDASPKICDLIDRAFTKVTEIWTACKLSEGDLEAMAKESPKTKEQIDDLEEKLNNVRDDEECLKLCQKYVNTYNHMMKRRMAMKAADNLQEIEKVME